MGRRALSTRAFRSRMNIVRSVQQLKRSATPGSEQMPVRSQRQESREAGRWVVAYCVRAVAAASSANAPAVHVRTSQVMKRRAVQQGQLPR
jgi:hypothetical protein